MKFGAYNGQGESLNDVNEKKSFGARATAAVTPKIDVGASWFTHDAIVTSNDVPDSSFSNTAWDIDAQYGKPGDEGLYALAEYLQGDDATPAKLSMRGIQGLVAYNVRMSSPTSWLYAVEPFARVDLADPDTRHRRQRRHTVHRRDRRLYVEQGLVPGGVRAPELSGGR